MQARQCCFQGHGWIDLLASVEEVKRLWVTCWHNHDMVAQFDGCVGAFKVEIDGSKSHRVLSWLR